MIRAVVFDLDGTVVESAYEWPEIRRRLGAGSLPILSYLEGLAEPERSRKRAELESIEEEATHKAVLKDGIRELLAFLRQAGLKTALVTNNSGRNVSLLLRKFNLEFDWVLSRDSGLWKPSGAPLREALDKIQVLPQECCAVGDSPFDVQAALEAGIPLVFLIGRKRPAPAEARVQALDSLSELQETLGRLIRG
ncbi:MAG TPA: HAD family hydrolase [Acidobacteriota bacterium]